ncbi:acetyltransferase [uncultured Aquimarina sp.]|uniref:acetyltransferase n=1 Tax=uncultured Aquimarina sp. TaxID=575652 RepID=UPI00260F2134|nr:acetyltransferase [uncultured Aquimarina sp.]
MKPLYIIGAGGAAKEIYLLVKELNKVDHIYEFKGFVDITTERFLQIGGAQHDIINESVLLHESDEKVAIVFGLGDINKLKKIVVQYTDKDIFEFPNIIHPSVQIDESISLGMGNVITTHSVFTVDTVLGSFNYINRGVHLGHDCKIGSYNVINPCSVISGGVTIGDENLIGTNATILQYLEIGSKNKIGAGAVVTKDILDNSCMIGIPAKNIE